MDSIGIQNILKSMMQEFSCKDPTCPLKVVFDSQGTVYTLRSSAFDFREDKKVEMVEKTANLTCARGHCYPYTVKIPRR